MKIVIAYNSLTEVWGVYNLNQIKQSHKSYESFTRDNTDTEMSFIPV